MREIVSNADNDVSPILSVSKALRQNDGVFKVTGTITSISKLFKMISAIKIYCDKCEKITEESFEPPIFNLKIIDKRCSYCDKVLRNLNCYYTSAIIVELQDLDTFNDLDRLSVVILDKNTENIRVGENVIIQGQMLIHEHHKIGKTLYPFFYAESLVYDKECDVILSQKDIDVIKRFTEKQSYKIIESLVSMLDPSIIGCEYVKKGLLLCAVNSASDKQLHNSSNLRRERIHALIIGEAGLAKSRLLRSITKIVPNSKFESGQSSSGKSLTAIVSKEQENYFLRLGSVSLARNALCAVNEFGRTSFEDQAHFLDVMEEGEFTINKHGINARIKAPTTIVASANPINNSKWTSESRIDINEIPALKPIIDRFDLIFVFRNATNEVDIRNYAYKKTELETKKVPNYINYIVKHIEYAKKFNPIISDEAKIMLNEFFIKIKKQGFGSNRILDTLIRLSKANARLKLKNLVDEQDAREIMDFYNVVLQNYQIAVNPSNSPKEVAFNESVSTLRGISFAISVHELMKTICEKNVQIALYLGYGKKQLKIETNRKVRDLYNMLLNHGNIRIINEKPIVLQWIEQPFDASDIYDDKKIKSKPTYLQNKNKTRLSDSPVSYASDMSGEKNVSEAIEKKHELECECYYCEFQTNSKKEYESHVILKHPRKLCYPGKADIEKERLVAKGKEWES